MARVAKKSTVKRKIAARKPATKKATVKKTVSPVLAKAEVALAKLQSDMKKQASTVNAARQKESCQS